MSVSNGTTSPDVAFTITDATASEFRAVVVGTGSTATTRKATIATASTSPLLGVLQAPTTAANTSETVRLRGISKLEVNGNSINITAGDKLVATTGGVGIPASEASDTEQWLIGIALAPSEADGDIIPVLLSTETLYVEGAA